MSIFRSFSWRPSCQKRNIIDCLWNSIITVALGSNTWLRVLNNRMCAYTVQYIRLISTHGAIFVLETNDNSKKFPRTYKMIRKFTVSPDLQKLFCVLVLKIFYYLNHTNLSSRSLSDKISFSKSLSFRKTLTFTRC